MWSGLLGRACSTAESTKFLPRGAAILLAQQEKSPKIMKRQQGKMLKKRSLFVFSVFSLIPSSVSICPVPQLHPTQLLLLFC